MIREGRSSVEVLEVGQERGRSAHFEKRRADRNSARTKHEMRRQDFLSVTQEQGRSKASTNLGSMSEPTKL
jgi:hypothetical protein